MARMPDRLICGLYRPQGSGGGRGCIYDFHELGRRGIRLAGSRGGRPGERCMGAFFDDGAICGRRVAL